MLRRSVAIVFVFALLAGCDYDSSGASTLDAAGQGPGDVDAALPPPDAEEPPSPDASPDAAPPPNRLIPIYVAASDESDADIAAHVATYDAIIGGIRSWYTERMAEFGPLAFYREPVRALRGHHTKAEWDDFGVHGFLYPDGTRTASDGGCSMYYGTLWELTDGGLLAQEGLPPPGSEGVLYYAIAGGGTNGSCGAGHYLGASELKILTESAAKCPAGRMVPPAVDCAMPGAVAHELGHGFGLPHGVDRPMCTDGPTLMDVWWQYDNGAKLCVEDRADLLASGFFAAP